MKNFDPIINIFINIFSYVGIISLFSWIVFNHAAMKIYIFVGPNKKKYIS